MNTVTVIINGVEYNLRGKEDEKYLLDVAAYVDTKIREISGSNKKLSTSSAAVLTAVNIADELFKCDLEIGNITKKKNSLEERHLTLKERLRELKVEIDETAKARAAEVDSLNSMIFQMEEKLKEHEEIKTLNSELMKKIEELTKLNNDLTFENNTLNNPRPVLPARRGGNSRGTAGVNSEEGGDDVRSSCPLRPGLHACYNGRYNGMRHCEVERIP